MAFIAFDSPGWPQAQPNLVPPVAAPEDFSNLVGFYLISATTDRSEVDVEDAIILTVSIRGNGPPAFQPQRARLRIFPEDIAEAFFIDPVPQKDRYHKKDSAWDFVYQLRPKSTDVRQVPSLKLVYYSYQKKFQSAFSEPLTLTVQPKAAVKFDAMPIQVPAGVLEIDGSEAALRIETPFDVPPPWLIVLAATLPAVLCVSAYFLWRRTHTELLKRRRASRSRIARHILQQLQANPEMTCVAAAELLTHYLQQRLDLPINEPTPAEVQSFLQQRGVPRTLRSEYVAFFEKCSQARFAPTPHTNGAYGKEVEVLVLALEGNAR